MPSKANQQPRMQRRRKHSKKYEWKLKTSRLVGQRLRTTFEPQLICGSSLADNGIRSVTRIPPSTCRENHSERVLCDLIIPLLIFDQSATNELLLNSLGTPNLSQFVTFGYSAGSHLDRDDSPTVGRVFQRSDEVRFLYLIPMRLDGSKILCTCRFPLWNQTFSMLPISYCLS